MHGTAFPQEARAELLEDAIAVHQNAPESLDVLGVVRRVMSVLVERREVIEFHGDLVEFYLNAKRLQRRHILRVEIGNRSWKEPHAMLYACAAIEQQLVSYQVEFDGE